MMTSFTGYWLTRGRPHCLARRLNSSFSPLAGTAGPRYRRCARAKLIAGSWQPVAPGKSRTSADLHRRQLTATSKLAMPVRCRSSVPRRRIEGWCSSTCSSRPIKRRSSATVINWPPVPAPTISIGGSRLSVSRATFDGGAKFQASHSRKPFGPFSRCSMRPFGRRKLVHRWCSPLARGVGAPKRTGR